MRAFHQLRLGFVPVLAFGIACANGQVNQSGPDPDPDPNGGNSRPTLRPIATGLDFPVHLTAPEGDPRLFVVEKGGRVLVVENGQVLPDPFLDVTALVSRGSEQGLLSIALHPDFASSGRFFVDYTDTAGDTRVVEYRVSGDPNRADAAPVRTILTVAQPFSNHNGGLIVFGPDGMLYVGLGDGGSGGDPQGHGQNLGTLLGSILRLDIDGVEPYAVPPDNPFVNQAGARGEIWAYGLRNPWRFAFDREIGDLYIADVGQNAIEEINAVDGAGGGLNYGWNVMEGSRCFEPREDCDTEGLTLPVLEYSHDQGCSVTGGHVYRGDALPSLEGLYFYSDFCSGFVRSFRLSGGEATDPRRWSEIEPPQSSVTSFGEDSDGELYILTAEGGVFKIVPQ
ncbi:MAG TPA: PQQ-dependent sugar dehydrogenase [Gemmatimonadota bacterium]|nr:PQQ-dependent sugar dehydrogenase [Gemmatimonadota bacterium]